VDLPTYEDVLAASQRISRLSRVTPILTSASLDALAGTSLYFKNEGQQRSGAFKFRGASNAALQASGATVATHSSGNHGAALALAARLLGKRCVVVVPEGASLPKVAAIEAYGATLIRCAPTATARAAGLARVVEEYDATPIHPYDDPHVIAGQGTATLELLSERPELDVIIVPIGGGGLFGGTAIAAHGHDPRIEVYAAEPAGADDAYRAFASGVHDTDFVPNTIADGLRTPLGVRNFALLRAHAKAVVRVSDAEILRAMRLLWERLKIVVEPSAAVPFAAVLTGTLPLGGKRVGIVLSGANVDLDAIRFSV
jgi:threonine dehydratase